MKKSLISIKNVSYFYYAQKHQEIGLSDISLDIYSGVNTLIVGESGSGKSTLLKIIYGKIKPSRGLVLYPEISREDIFYLRDRKHVLLNKSLLQNALLYEDDVEKIEQIATDLDVFDLLDLKIRNLSGGEMDMALIALSIISKTSLVLLDEPFANVDDKWAIKTVEYINKIRNKTFVIVSQKPYLFEKEKYRIVTIKKHKIDAIKDIDNSNEIEENKLIEPSKKVLNRRTRYDIWHFVSILLVTIVMLFSSIICIQNTSIAMDKSIKNTEEFSTLIYKDNLDTFSYEEMDHLKSRYGASFVSIIPTSLKDARDTMKINDKYYMDVSLSYNFREVTHSSFEDDTRVTTNEKGVLIEGYEPQERNEIGVTKYSGLTLGEEVSVEISYDDFETTVTLDLVVTGIYEESSYFQYENFEDLYGKTIYVTKGFYTYKELFSLNTNFPILTYWLDGYYVPTIGNFYDFDPENPTTQTLYLGSYDEANYKYYDPDKTYYLDVKFINGAMLDFKIPVKIIKDMKFFEFVYNDVNYGLIGSRDQASNIRNLGYNSKAGFSVPLASSLIVTFGEGNEENIHRFYIEYMSKINYSNFNSNSYGQPWSIDFSLEESTFSTEFDKLIYIVISIVILDIVLALLILGKPKSMTTWELLENMYIKRRRVIDLILLSILLLCSIITFIVYYQFVYALFRPMILISLLLMCFSFVPLVVFNLIKVFKKC